MALQSSAAASLLFEHQVDKCLVGSAQMQRLEDEQS